MPPSLTARRLHTQGISAPVAASPGDAVRHLGATLWQRVSASKATRLICPATLAGLETGAAAVTLRLSTGEAVTARLVVPDTRRFE